MQFYNQKKIKTTKNINNELEVIETIDRGKI